MSPAARRVTGHIWGAGNSIVSFGVQGLAAHSGQQGLGSLIQLLVQCGKSGNALDPDIGRLLVEDLRILAMVLTFTYDDGRRRGTNILSDPVLAYQGQVTCAALKCRFENGLIIQD